MAETADLIVVGGGIVGCAVVQHCAELLPAGARIVLRAVGDMDCDGAQTTFERSGVVTADGRLEMAPPVEAIEPIE
jgi:precorrin-6B methylase 2